MNYFFGKPDVSALAMTITERGWNIDNVDIAVIPTVVITSSEFENGTSRSISASPPVISLLHGNAILPLSEDSPVMFAVGSCLEHYFRLPAAVDRADAPVVADHDNALLIVPAKRLINHHQAFERAELAARAYDRHKSEANWQEHLAAEWDRFQLQESFKVLPCDEATFRDIFTENASLKHPLPLLETYRHFWQSRQANLDGDQPSPFAIGVVERCLKAGIEGKWQSEIAAEVIRSLSLHPLHYNLFHDYVARLLAAAASGK